MERLQKVIAASGIASRRAAEQLIADGKVKVNGQLVTILGTRVDSQKDSILVNDHILPKTTVVTYLFNKPPGVICSRKAQQKNEQIVTDFFPKFPVIYPVGRLDKESEGLLIMSNDGELAQRLIHPSFSHQKVYRVVAEFKDANRSLSVVELEAKLRHGVKLGDGKAKVDHVRIIPLPENQLELVLTVHEGRHHLIRRICASLGLKVKRLIRTQVGPFHLSNLKSGKYRLLSPEEISHL